MKKKKIILFILMSLTLTCPLISISPTEDSTVSAQPEAELRANFKTFIGTIVTIIGSIYIRILALAGLIHSAIKLIITKNKDEFGKKFVAWMIACILVNLTPAVVNRVFEIKDSIKSLQTFSLFDTPSFGNSKKK